MVALKHAYHLLLLLVLMAICIGPKASFGQYDQLNFSDLEIDGIPFKQQINTLFQDSYGFLWMGTNTGLYRYDGHRLKAFQYDVFDPSSIPNNSINSIVEDDYRNLWLGSESYLIRFNRRDETFDYFYKNQTAVCLGKGSDGTIWANLRKVGLAKITPKPAVEDLVFETYFNYSDDGIIPENKVLNAICEDEFGRTWLGTPTGLYYLDAQHKLQSTNIREPVTTLIKGTNQTFWINTPKSIFRLEYARSNTTLTVLDHYPFFSADAPPNERILSLLLDQNRQLWVGTNNGLYRGMREMSQYQFDKVQSYAPSNGQIHKDQINTLALDQFGNVWLGSNKGVKKLVSRSSVFRFNALEALDGRLNNQKLLHPILDQHQQLWFGISSGGLYRLNIRTRDFQKIIDTPRRVNTIQYTHDQSGLLVGVGPDLFKLETLNAEKPAMEVLGTFDQSIQDIVQVNPQEIWLGLWGGGLRIMHTEEKPGGYKQELLAKTLGDNVSVMLQDSKRNVWIGTRGQGIYRVDLKNQSFEHYLPSRSSGLSSNAFLSIFEDRDHQIWMGTRGGGLIRYNENQNQFTAYSRKDGLLANTITAIEEDDHHNLWLSTPRGLVRFQKESRSILNFTAEDGILESQFAYNSSTASPDGKILYFGTGDGFYEIYPDAFQQSKTLPRTVITSFNILDHETDQVSAFREQIGGLITDSAAITLPHHQNSFSLEFSSLDLTAPNKNQFAYRLEGVNDNWIVAGRSIRNASYYDLAHGTYTFRVKSTNSDGLWNEEPSALRINIRPPFWLTGWAYAIYTLLCLGIITAILIASRNWYQLKKNLVKETVSREKDNEYHRMRMVFFTDISHELRTPLTLIINAIEQLVKGKKQQLEPAGKQRIYTNALKMKQLINQIMDIRKYSEGEFRLKVTQRDVVPYLKMLTSTFSDHAGSQGIELHFRAQEPKINAWLDVFIVEKIISNLLSNALKFTPSQGKIQLSVSKEYVAGGALKGIYHKAGDFLKITVEDNGIGIAPEDLQHIFNRYYQASNNLKANSSGSTGIGMELVYKLVKLHHGLILVESQLEMFTRFEVYLPLSSDQYAEHERRESPMPVLKDQIASLPEPMPEDNFSPIDAAPDQYDAATVFGSKPSILLVEDNSELRSMMREILVKNYTVLEAEHGGKGFELALKEQPQIIISDILMPEVDGISLLKRLKEQAATRHIPVFLLTAKVNDEVKRESIQHGAEDFIEKPFSMDFLEWKVANALKTRKILEEKYSKKITTAPSEVELESPDEKLIQELVQLVEDHLNDPKLSVEFLADQVGMSRANLYRKLQKILDETPVAFIRRLKLQRAQQILAMKKFYVAEVAYMCGFKSQRYFSKCFVKEFGYTPTQYASQVEELDVILDQ